MYNANEIGHTQKQIRNIKMKTKKMMATAAVVALLGAQLNSASTFAYNYGIEYTGGTPLGGSNVTIDPNRINSLTPLIQTGTLSTTASPNDIWQRGYINGSSGCNPVYYLSIDPNPVQSPVFLSGSTRRSQELPSFKISNGKYYANVSVLNTYFDTVDGEDIDGDIAVAVRADSNYIYGGWQIYTDATCETVDGDIVPLSSNSNKRLFVEMRASIFKEGSDDEPYIVDGMYFGITDIDSAQSYKILNDGNEFSEDNMFAVSANDLQPGPNGYKNMYVPEGNYIYSEYESNSAHVVSDNKANIYTELNLETQEGGVEFVFGFAGRAASGIEYLGRLYNVQYDADKNGEITGIVDEDVMPGDYASGSAYKAKGSHKFLYWVADVDVTLDDEDSTEIKAGKPITNDQIKKVIVDKDIKFTAIFDDVKVPNTGMSTMETNAAMITTSFLGILIIALALRSLPRFTKRKVNFD